MTAFWSPSRRVPPAGTGVLEVSPRSGTGTVLPGIQVNLVGIVPVSAGGARAEPRPLALGHDYSLRPAPGDAVPSPNAASGTHGHAE
jgi:hypothetical protein